MNEFTLVVPYYRNPIMLRRQAREWLEYPPQVKVIVVDDGSPESAAQALSAYGDEHFGAFRGSVRLLRADVDIPWNRGGARNLGAQQASTDWIVHVDIDHVLPAASARELLTFRPRGARWFRFRRYRVGAADATRKKDRLADDCQFGEVHPHVDSYLIRRADYWKSGGYDEDYSGGLGGGNPFLAVLLQDYGPPQVLPSALHVYTRDAVPDASDWSLSRDTTEHKRRYKIKAKAGNIRGSNPVRFPWHEVNL